MNYTGVRGTTDFKPPEAALFNEVTRAARKIFKLFGFEEIILPVLEEEGVFRKGVGEATDIVERQIFKIEGKDPAIALRPEGTAQAVRFFLENSLHKQSDFYKFFYLGAMFRGERPQKGRLRQFHHIGAEVFGSNSFYIDADVIILAVKILDEIGIREKELKINTLGCLKDKEKFSALLKNSLTAQSSLLCPDCQRRLNKNPLRVLDCKNEGCRQAVKAAKLGTSHICGDCRKHFDSLLATLDDCGVKYVYDPYLVRGLDYYTNTVFEFSSSALGSQDAIGAGGRYNHLVANLGGPEIPAIGFALGIERILIVLGKAGVLKPMDVFIVVTSSQLIGRGYKILQDLRASHISGDIDYCDKSLKGQFRYAQKKNAKFVIVVGEEELKDDCVMVKNMATSQQDKVKITDLVKQIQNPKGKS